MDIIIANADGYELGYLTGIQQFDLDTTNSYDFEIQMDLTAFAASGYTYGYRVYCPETEFGGTISDIEIVSSESMAYIRGDTWRGMLRKKIICPPDGEDYMIETGEAHAIMRDLVGTAFGDLIAVDSSTSAYTINKYQFNRYCTMEEGFTAMLESVGAKLVIIYDQDAGQAILSAAAIETHGEEYTDDQIHLAVRDYRRGINHLICLGRAIWPSGSASTCMWTLTATSAPHSIIPAWMSGWMSMTTAVRNPQRSYRQAAKRNCKS